MTALTTTRTLDADRRAKGTDLGQFAKLLEEQRVNTVDLVVPASKLSMEDGALHVRRTVSEPEITPEGVRAPGEYSFRYTPGRMADDGFSSRLNIPKEFLARQHNGGLIAGKPITANLNSYDALINLQLEHEFYRNKKFLVRVLQGNVAEHGTEGYVRAFLTDGYRVIDHLDVLTATFQGIREAGVDPHALKIECDLTESRMYVRVHAPEVAVAAQDLLRGYRSPWAGGLTGDQLPLVFAGFVITNSETGHGKAAITPQAIVQACSNGLTWKADVMAEVHLGKRQEEGVIKWSDRTNQIELELIKSQAADAVRTFLSREYVQRKVDEMAEKAAVGIDREASEDAVEVVRKDCAFTQTEARDVLADFLGGGQFSVGGMVQAVTSAAQRSSDADRQWHMEGATERVLALAPKLARV